MTLNWRVLFFASVISPALVLACSDPPTVVMIEGNPKDTSEGDGKDGAQVDADAGAAGSDANEDGTLFDPTADDPVGTCISECEADQCGPIADGCGDFIECGDCDAPEICGGGGVPSRCGGTTDCTPQSCEDVDKQCGKHADGCGGLIDCWGDAELNDDGDPMCPAGSVCFDGKCDSLSSCEPLTCDDYASDPDLCGPVSDGCGNTLDCDFGCSDSEICGANEPGICGSVDCEPMSCDDARDDLPDGYCGYVADGCGGEIADCAVECSGGETCGGGGVADVCGEGAMACEPRDASDCEAQCGFMSDGCGGTVDCGGCEAPESCGGGGVASMCGAPTCNPRTCDNLGAECGSVADGCGDTIACGTCSSDEVCNANLCETVSCTPLTEGEVCSGLCGAQSDGCGGTVDCGGCASPESCGGGGVPSVCGAPSCTPLTCDDVGANCGPIGDGCGGIISSCGSCEAPEICGGAGVPSVCGEPTVDDTCVGLCEYQVPCDLGEETRLTGTVYAPNGLEPLANVLVYIPQAAIPEIDSGVSCGRCADEELGEPLVAAISDTDGTFTLENVPADVAFPLVVKIGKWRRVVTVPAVAECTARALAATDTRLPRSMADASAENVEHLSIPQVAMVTGDVDELECVLRKIGVDDSEFTLPSASGRIHLYRANGASAGCTNYRSNGVECRSSGRVNADISTLFDGDTLDDYDVAIFGCEGSANEHSDNYDPALRDWANRGGRVFASHYSYVYLHDDVAGDDAFETTAVWGGPWKDNDAITPGIIDTSFSKGEVFNEWLGNVGAHHATYGNGYIEIQDPRDYVMSVDDDLTDRFVYTDASHTVDGDNINLQTAVQQYSFNTPVGADEDNICGRVLYSAFHVANASDNNDEVFPTHCSSAPLTPQEKVLEYMLFDLSSCVSTDVPDVPTCTPRSCESASAECGYLADGCGGLLDCGVCSAPDVCGGGGEPNQCGTNCTQTTCGAEGANCGVIADGCGGTLNCGSCDAPALCGGGGTANVCGTPQCQPRTCQSVGASCGPISDGCGGTVDCGDCEDPEVCGGGGTPNVCGSGDCNPLTCSSQGAECGFIGDGCGGTVACGTCPDGESCGAGGPNVCGPACVPRTCESVGASCGFIGDGCGSVINCGVCEAPEVCGGGGTPSQCGGSCTPRTCSAANAECGAISDGCGSVLQCGSCEAPEVCGGAGMPNQCGAGNCTPRTCSAAGAECGQVGDGCGDVLDCGNCEAPESCGGDGTPNQCGEGGCVPLSCEDQGADCGPVADGCGGLLDCGSCDSGEYCGGGGASLCGSIIK